MASRQRGPGHSPTRADEARNRPPVEDEDMSSPAPEGTRMGPLSDDDDYPLPQSEGTRMGPVSDDDDYPRSDSTRVAPSEDLRSYPLSRADETRVAAVEDLAPSPDATRISSRDLELRPSRGSRLSSSPDATRITTSPRELASQQDSSNRTTFSNQAAMIADVLRERFSRKVYGRNPNRVLRVDEPEGPSTSGGRQARQPLLLVPRKGAVPPILCGWVDVARREAQIRSHESAARRFQAQHGMPLDVFPADYERFIDDVVDTLHSGGIRVRVLIPDEPLSAAEGGTGKAPQQVALPSWLIALLVAGGVVLGAVIGLILGRRF
jgi:hypothetical protein